MVDTQAVNSLDNTKLSELSISAPAKIASARASIILGRIIFYTLLVLMAAVATPYGIVSPWRELVEAGFACGVFALGVLWMIEGMLSGRWVTRTHLLLLPLLLLTAFAYIQTLPLGSSSGTAGISVPIWQAISFDPYETRFMVLKLLAYSIALGILLRYTSSPGRLRVLIFFVIGIGVASALFALLRQTTQGSAPEFLFPAVRLNGGYGQFVNRNHFAYLMEMGLGLAMGLLTGGMRRDRLLLYLSAAIPIWVALVLSNSRGGILSMLCQLLLLASLITAVRSPKKSETGTGDASSWLTRISDSPIFRLTLGALLLAAALIGVIWVGGEQIVSRFETMQDEVAADVSNSGSRRQEIWGATWEMIKTHPLSGVGLGGYWTAIPQYHNASGKMTPQQAHNDYLELLASGGVVGILLGGWFIFLLVKFARQSLRTTEPFRRAACCGALTGLFGIAIHSSIDFGLHIPVNALISVTLIAIAAFNGQAENKKNYRPGASPERALSDSRIR